MEKYYGALLSVNDRLKEFHDIIDLSKEAIEKNPQKTDLVIWPEGSVHFPILNYRDIFNQVSQLRHLRSNWC